MAEEVLGIVCPGSPAPGINLCISALTDYSARLGWSVLGFHDGFLHLATGDFSDVSANLVHFGVEKMNESNKRTSTLLRTHEFDPTRSPEKVMNCIRMLVKLKVKYLVVIGGNEEICMANFISSGIDPADMKLLVIPKTIDNDIHLPNHMQTLGFVSARTSAIPIVRNLMLDAKSAPRWFLVETIGRRSGHLALSICQATGANLAIIPEDFGKKKIELNDISDVIEGTILKSLVYDENFGVCLLSESLINQLSTMSIQELSDNEILFYNKDGRLTLDNAEISRAVRIEIQKRLEKRKIAIKVAANKLGYEIRSCDPCCFDAVYAQELAYGAIEGFRSDHSNSIVISQAGSISYLSFRSILDQDTGKVIPRKVDTNSETYKIARSYMKFITKDDLANPEFVRKLAEVANSTPEEIVSHFKRSTELIVQ